jgi:hypothetical protein
MIEIYNTFRQLGHIPSVKHFSFQRTDRHGIDDNNHHADKACTLERYHYSCNHCGLNLIIELNVLNNYQIQHCSLIIGERLVRYYAMLTSGEIKDFSINQYICER